MKAWQIRYGEKEYNIERKTHIKAIIVQNGKVWIHREKWKILLHTISLAGYAHGALLPIQIGPREQSPQTDFQRSLWVLCCAKINRPWFNISCMLVWFLLLCFAYTFICFVVCACLSCFRRVCNALVTKLFLTLLSLFQLQARDSHQVIRDFLSFNVSLPLLLSSSSQHRLCSDSSYLFSTPSYIFAIREDCFEAIFFLATTSKGQHFCCQWCGYEVERWYHLILYTFVQMGNNYCWIKRRQQI